MKSSSSTFTAKPPETASVSSALAMVGERRLEASAYLADGYGIRRRIELADGGWLPFGEVAEVWQPSRLKGLTVRAGLGLPFLSAGQVFESAPRVRKWLSRGQTRDAEARRVDARWLLMSCSGEVGRVTAVYPQHLGPVITHDLLRIAAKEAHEYGWLYAYMKTSQFYQIARAAQYGHMIKHLEVSHVVEMPVVWPQPEIRAAIGAKAVEAIAMRTKARDLQAEADDLYASHFPESRVDVEPPFHTIPASALFQERRRLEAQYYRPRVRDIEMRITEGAERVDVLSDVTKLIALPNRFKRYFGDNGAPYKSPAELFDVNPPVMKRIYPALIKNPEMYRLMPSSIVMARSGQVYGLLGRSRIIPDSYADTFGSDDMIRIVPNGKAIRPGYLVTVLNHEELGRPMVVRNASGTSVPHLDPVDIREVPVPRLGVDAETRVADLADEATALSDRADALETEAISEAAELVDEAAQG